MAADNEDPIQYNEETHVPDGDDDLLNTAIPVDESVTNQDPDEGDKIDLVEQSQLSQEKKKIQTFDREKRHDQLWKRPPNVSGQGASHVRTFIAKLRADTMLHLDEQINEWLDDHPDYEVKFVTTSVGTLISKNPEPAMFMNVWV